MVICIVVMVPYAKDNNANQRPPEAAIIRILISVLNSIS